MLPHLFVTCAHRSVVRLSNALAHTLGTAEPRAVPPADEPEPDDESRERRARECATRGDNPCMIGLLEGHARTRSATALLIEAHRAQGRTEQAVPHMLVFVRRWGNSPQGRNYRQLLDRRER
ncbi:MAG: hypothetical protein AB7P00_43075 [Sandaracinaceae bacterium]